MRTCDHVFITIKDIEREVIVRPAIEAHIDAGSTAAPIGVVGTKQVIAGKLVVCAYCGEQRKIYADGYVEKIKGNEV